MLSVISVPETELGRLLAHAIERKAAQMPDREYSYRDLERDSAVSYSYAQKVVKGTVKPPSRATIEAWAKALAPFLPEDQALMAAGYMPKPGPTLNVIQRAIADMGRYFSGDRLQDKGTDREARDEGDSTPPEQP